LLAFSNFIDFLFPSHLNQINALVDSEREHEQIFYVPFNHTKEAGMVQKFPQFIPKPPTFLQSEKFVCDDGLE
jgi:hypothetical protein